MIKNYFKIAFRNLWKRRGFSLLNILGLAIGFTAGFLILMYVDFELSYDNFHSKGERIYRVASDIEINSKENQANKPDWATPPLLASQFPEIQSAVRILYMPLTVRNNHLKFRENNAIAVDSGFFEVFDFKLRSGNKKEALKTPFSVVLSETASKKYFGNENPMGKSLQILDKGFQAKVTGIMKDIPGNSHIKADMLLSMTTFTQVLDKDLDTDWGNFEPYAYVLLKPNVDVAQLESKFPLFMKQNFEKQMEASKMYIDLLLVPLKEIYMHATRGGPVTGNIHNIYVFSIIAVFILLIACINFINLTTARSVERAREVGIRKVVGASKKQLGHQFLGESAIISVLAFLVSLVILKALLPSFNVLAGKVISEGIFSNPNQIIILFLFSIAVGLMAGAYPALVLTSYDPVNVLKGSFSKSSRGVALRKGLVVLQFVISITLIIGTIVIYMQTDYMRSQELGFNKEQVLVMETQVSPAQKAFKDAINQLPGIIGTSSSSSVPGGDNSEALSQLENKDGDLLQTVVNLYFVDFDYLSQLDIELISGRGFSRDFASDSTQAMIVNEAAVELLGYTSPESALGARFKQWGREGQIIGVVKNFNFNSLQQQIEPLSMRIEQTRLNLITAKIKANTIEKSISQIKRQWEIAFPEEPFDFYFLDQLLDKQYRSEQRFGTLFLWFAILAITISCLGLLGLTAYSIIQRKREISIRKILGASVSKVVNLVSQEFLKLIGIAFLIAIPISWLAMNQWLKDFAFRINIQWWMFVIAGVIALFLALITIGFHSMKAALTNPTKNLRTE
ncbi:ABC transporter permease [Galbibacter pacificus]|uniref:ABC transporter permease n=1 Tax=Galbibacter pacificus TaxID=2996052 RepID=A0ABT6FRY4_9FLAO|nr:ABC transporter permease [Galbibacter pacificus]MDG3582849.1 ABC transporter permease [Galbibacter pacificus]MDG3586032.1 ABC transporter permease [Galbibacter pacificus]